MCFMMDPLLGKRVCYVQFPQRFDGIDTNDRYANRNTVFFDVRVSIKIQFWLLVVHWRIWSKYNSFLLIRLTWKVWMAFKDQFMLGLDVFLGGWRSMVTMLQRKISRLLEPVIVQLNGAGADSVLDVRRWRRKEGKIRDKAIKKMASNQVRMQWKVWKRAPKVPVVSMYGLWKNF